MQFLYFCHDLDIPRNSLPDYIAYLEKAHLLSALREKISSNSIMRKIDKIYLDNPNMAYALPDSEFDLGNTRETVFIAWVKDLNMLTALTISDFEIDNRTFEVAEKEREKTNPNRNGKLSRKQRHRIYIPKYHSVVDIWACLLNCLKTTLKSKYIILNLQVL